MKKGRYFANKMAAITKNTDPTMTDQAAANETDINVIVKKFAVHGQVPGASGQPMSGDFTQIPTSLREMIEKTREVADLRKKLPPELRSMTMPELLALTPEQLKNKLTPPEPPAKTTETTT